MLALLLVPAGSALARARALAAEAPAPSGTTDGEFEGHEWWERHTPTLRDAWRESPRTRAARLSFESATQRVYAIRGHLFSRAPRFHASGRCAAL